MSCVECNSTERVFPLKILTDCIQKDSFKETNIGSFIRGWGNKYITTSKYLVEFKVFIKTPEERTIFEQWYSQEVGNGALDFRLNFPLRGLTRDWKVRFIEHYNVQEYFGVGANNTFKVEVLGEEDKTVEEILNEYCILCKEQ